MIVDVIGNSSFLIKTSLGKRIVFCNSIEDNRTEIKALKPNIICISNNTLVPSILNEIFKESLIICNEGFFQSDEIRIDGFFSYRDNCHGLKRGKNIVYKINIENINIVYLGSIGHTLNDNLLRNLGEIFLLFLPIGGHLSIDYREASNIISLLNPNIIIPIEFKTLNSKEYLDGPHKFLKYIKNINVTPFKYLDLSTTPIRSKPEIYLPI